MTNRVAIIGGSGLYQLEGFEVAESLPSESPYGETSAIIQSGRWQSCEVIFFPRHGKVHKIPPHKINYRANMWALKQAGVSSVIAVNAVGGIHQKMGPESIVIPHQIIDYTWGREHSYSDGNSDGVQHIDFTYPFTPELREQLLAAADRSGIEVFSTGVYGCTNGPRLETVAEINRMANDGCDLVGMTAMPEAALARELGIDYAGIAVVVNAAAGLNDGQIITMDQIMSHLQQGLSKVTNLLAETVRRLSQ